MYCRVVKSVLSFISRCSDLRRFDCLLLVFIRWWGQLVSHHLLHYNEYGRIDAFWSLLYRRETFPSAISSYVSWPWHPRFGNFDSVIPVDVIGVKSDVESFLVSTVVPVSTTLILGKRGDLHRKEWKSMTGIYNFPKPSPDEYFTGQDEETRIKENLWQVSVLRLLQNWGV